MFRSQVLSAVEKGAHKETVFAGGGGSKQASHAEQPSEVLVGGSGRWVGEGFPGRTLQEGHLRQGSGGAKAWGCEGAELAVGTTLL